MREEAIKSALKFLVLKQKEQGSWGYADNDNINKVSWNEVLEWIDKQPCGDLISRQAVLDIAKSSKSNWIDNSVLFKRVNELPPVTPQPEERTEEHTGEINADGYGWVALQYSAQYHIIDDHLTRSNGVVYFMGHRETWYSTNEASGKATAWEIPGKHVADDGTIRDENGYICVASSDLAFYSIVMTSVGPGKVYDTGCSNGTIDVYTNW